MKPAEIEKSPTFNTTSRSSLPGSWQSEFTAKGPFDTENQQKSMAVSNTDTTITQDVEQCESASPNTELKTPLEHQFCPEESLIENSKQVKMDDLMPTASISKVEDITFATLDSFAQVGGLKVDKIVVVDDKQIDTEATFKEVEVSATTLEAIQNGHLTGLPCTAESSHLSDMNSGEGLAHVYVHMTVNNQTSEPPLPATNETEPSSNILEIESIDCIDFASTPPPSLQSPRSTPSITSPQLQPRTSSRKVTTSPLWQDGVPPDGVLPTAEGSRWRPRSTYSFGSNVAIYSKDENDEIESVSTIIETLGGELEHDESVTKTKLGNEEDGKSIFPPNEETQPPIPGFSRVATGIEDAILPKKSRGLKWLERMMQNRCSTILEPSPKPRKPFSLLRKSATSAALNRNLSTSPAPKDTASYQSKATYCGPTLTPTVRLGEGEAEDVKSVDEQISWEMSTSNAKSKKKNASSVFGSLVGKTKGYTGFRF